MWSPDGHRARAAALACALLLGGCTVQPLYSSSVSPAASATDRSTKDALRSINVAPVASREVQEVRNELIFLFSGGQGNEKQPAYTMTLSAYSTAASSTIAPIVGRDQVPTSQILTFTGNYTLIEAATGKVVGRGTRQAVANYDMPVQQFAQQRAFRDAQDRAARELAAAIAAAAASDLATGRVAAGG